jgi:hypothetical protein
VDLYGCADLYMLMLLYDGNLRCEILNLNSVISNFNEIYILCHSNLVVGKLTSTTVTADPPSNDI